MGLEEGFWAAESGLLCLRKGKLRPQEEQGMEAQGLLFYFTVPSFQPPESLVATQGAVLYVILQRVRRGSDPFVREPAGVGTGGCRCSLC